MTLPSAELITNWYNFGQGTTPNNLLDERWIRPSTDQTTLLPHVEVGEFMTSGPGRFARGSMSSLVQAFFSAETYWNSLIPDGSVQYQGYNYDPQTGRQTFSKDALAHFFGITSYGISIDTKNFKDETDDYTYRAYVWGHTGYKLADNALFVIEPDGQRYIENYAIVPRDYPTDEPGLPGENFDFRSGNDPIVDFLLEVALTATTDPSGIGRNVKVDWQGTPPSAITYGIVNYNYDAEKVEEQWVTEDWDKLHAEGMPLVEQLFEQGPTRFLWQNKPVVYGTVDSDSLDAEDVADPTQFWFLSDYVENGVAFISAGGTDTLKGGEHNDYLRAGLDDDTLIGGAGDDELHGGEGTDKGLADGLDTADYSTSISRIKVDLTTGTASDGFGGTDKLISIEGFIGSDHDDEFKVNDKQLKIDGGKGSDLVDCSAVLSGITVDVASDIVLGGTGGTYTLKSIEYITGSSHKDLFKVDETVLKIDGGAEIDTVDYSHATTGVNVTLSSGQVAFQSGANQELKGIENVTGSNYIDHIDGDGEDNVLNGGGSNDVITGGGGNDTIYGGDGNDRIDGGELNNTLEGGAGRDTIVGGVGNDTIKGDGEDDTLDAGGGIDRLTGGAGGDTFIAYAGTTITDPEKHDHLKVGNTYYTGGLQELDANGIPIPNKYRGENGEIYRESGDNLIVELPGGGVITLEKWYQDYAGIHLTPQQPAPTHEPLVFDLDGDGFELFSLRDPNFPSSGAYFDMDVDGLRELTGWVMPDDALLVIDRNQNGSVDNATELVGAGWFAGSGEETSSTAATTGFRELMLFDDNYDGVVNGLDEIFASLRLWQDLDSDGVTDEGELKTLSEFGILSLSTIATDIPNMYFGSSYVAQTATYTTADGHVGQAGEAWFRYNAQLTLHDDVQITDPTVLALPDIPGVGQAADLRVAMASDPTLKDLVADLAATTASDVGSLVAQVDAILLRWTGADAVDPFSRGGFANGQWITAEESNQGATQYFNGQPSDLNATGGTEATNNYQINRAVVLTELLAQISLGQELFPGLTFKMGVFITLPEGTSLSATLANLAAHAPADETAKLQYWNAMVSVLQILQTQFAEPRSELVAAVDTALVNDGIGYTMAQLTAALIGGDGDDVLIGRNYTLKEVFQAAELLVGGAGDDTLIGGDGGDTYVFGRGYAADQIQEAGEAGVLKEGWNTDIVRFTADVSLADVTFSKEEGTNNLLLSIKDTSDQLRILGQLDYASPAVERFEFADGTVLTWADIHMQFFPVSAGDDYVVGANGRDDVLNGGAGNDKLEGGTGNDTYQFGKGYGQDTIHEAPGFDGHNDEEDLSNDTLQFGEGISSTDLEWVRTESNPDDLVIKIAGTSDQLTITGQFDGLASSIEQFVLADGTKLSAADVRALLLSSTSDDDTVIGYYRSADVLDGGAGNDILEGLSGSDTYVFGYGYGYDTIVDYNNDIYHESFDIIQFTAGVSASDVTFSRSGTNSNDLVISLAGSDDNLTVSEQFLESYGVEALHFADGTVVTIEQIRSTLLSATTGDDVLLGYHVDDSLSGGAGNDLLEGREGADTLDGGAGNDRLEGQEGADTYIFGRGYGQDLVVGFAGAYDFSDNIVRLNADVDPDDVMLSRSGNNLVLQIAGTNDVLTVQDNYKSFTDYVSSIEFADGTVWDAQFIRDFLLTGTAGDDHIVGFSNADEVFDGGTGNDLLEGGEGADTYVFGRGYGHDVIVEPSWDSNTIQLNADVAPSDVKLSISADGQDLILEIVGTPDKLTVEGQVQGWHSLPHGIEAIRFADGTVWSADEITSKLIVSTPGDDNIQGFVGAETLDGGAGNDTLSGGFGTDTYIFGRGYGQDRISDDSYSYNIVRLNADVAPSDVLISQNGNDLVLEIVGTSDKLTWAWQMYNWHYDSLNRGLAAIQFADGTVWSAEEIVWKFLASTSGNDNIVGFWRADLINGGEGDDSLNGVRGNDTLVGGTGNDTLDGGAGADKLVGGAGSDTYKVDRVDDVTIEKAGEGNDLVQSSVTYTLTANVENLTLTGSSAINGIGNELDNVLTGNSGVNQLTGRAGNDTLNGGSGADIMEGGTGNDTYIVDTANDVTKESADEGADLVQTAVNNYMLAANLENLTLTGSSGITGTGNALDNVLTGNTGANQLFGEAGNDRLDGGAGNDTMKGGTGNDTYVVQQTGDVVTENPGEGIDTIESAIKINALADNVENLILTGASAINGTGNELDNVITGNSAANTLDGGVGADTLIGGGGSDTYLVDNTGDVITENADEGTDLVQSSAATYALAANVENLTLMGSAAIDGTGNELDNALTGNTGANKLTGGAGNDILNGGTGIDTMSGGTGNDLYMVDNTDDVIIENADEGTDLVQSSAAKYELAANVENLTLIGSSGITGTGNELDNVLTGNTGANLLIGGAGNDRLDGGAGNDTMQGGTGNDIYVVQVGGDVVTELVGEGIDTIESSITITTLAANVENLILTGGSPINGTGNGLDNAITGNGGANTLDGGAGADSLVGGGGNDSLNGGTGVDSMQGGTGNDTYVVDDTGDVTMESAEEGTDLVQSSAMLYTLSANIENLTLTGSSAINGTGNGLDNVITGNTGANQLDGAAGNDRLDGGAGNDTMTGGTGDDTFVVQATGDVVNESAGEGTDTIESSIIITALANNVENLKLTGSSAINGTGNALDNFIIGNSGANQLNGGAGNDRLDGGAGSDTMTGGTGDDTFVVQVAGDVVNESAGEGTDTIESSIAITLGNNVENLVLTGASAINGTGNALNNALTGNGEVNTLSGGSGNDTLLGGGGADNLFGGDGVDLLVWDGADTLNGGNGRDTLVFSSSGTLQFDVARMLNLEVINLGGGDDNNNGVALSVSDVLNLASSSGGSGLSANGDDIDLFVLGDADGGITDDVNLTGGWTTNGTFTSSAVNGVATAFNLYVANGVQVAVQQGMEELVA